jgi:hypothetical protein
MGIAMTMTTYPTLVSPFKPGDSNPLFDMMAKVGSVYSDSMQSNANELWMSSARIVQEHATRAMVNATQECIAALTENAADLHHRSLARLGSANQEAMTLMTTAFTNAMMGGFKPVA